MTWDILFWVLLIVYAATGFWEPPPDRAPIYNGGRAVLFIVLMVLIGIRVFPFKS
jgi:hypothetical protein